MDPSCLDTKIHEQKKESKPPDQRVQGEKKIEESGIFDGNKNEQQQPESKAVMKKKNGGFKFSTTKKNKYRKQIGKNPLLKLLFSRSIIVRRYFIHLCVVGNQPSSGPDLHPRTPIKAANGIDTGKFMEEIVSLEDMTESKNDKDSRQSINMLKEHYKLPLVWIDLEMTGLNVEVDRILEIACVITDGKLKKLVEGPDLVIHQTKDCLDKMGEWCQDHHAASEKTIKFIVDNVLLQKYMPDLASLFSHVVVDVSSVKALCRFWFPKDKKAPRKEKKHRAMDDIKESIAELKYYKEHVFKSPKSKK